MENRIETITWLDLAKKYVENTIGKRPAKGEFPIVSISPENNLYRETARILADRFNAPASFPTRSEDGKAKVYGYKVIEPLADFLLVYPIEQIKLLIAELKEKS